MPNSRTPRQKPSEEAPLEPEGAPVDQKPDPDVQEAIEEEQRLLVDAAKDAQIQHLLNRCINLSARLRKAERKAAADKS